MREKETDTTALKGRIEKKGGRKGGGRPSERAHYNPSSPEGTQTQRKKKSGKTARLRDGKREERERALLSGKKTHHSSTEKKKEKEGRGRSGSSSRILLSFLHLRSRWEKEDKDFIIAPERKKSKKGGKKGQRDRNSSIFSSSLLLFAPDKKDLRKSTPQTQKEKKEKRGSCFRSRFTLPCKE